ncbi:hypothetical protein GCM10007858_76340 [Bradyrhizobium liaoningense]|nr:hypothetical protein GCM10007858_76340 [Bradyrhizobium liaoningense]
MRGLESLTSFRNNLRFKMHPKNSDMDDALTVFGLQVAENFLCPLGTLAIQSSNVLVDSHQTVSEMTLKQRF